MKGIGIENYVFDITLMICSLVSQLIQTDEAFTVDGCKQTHTHTHTHTHAHTHTRTHTHVQPVCNNLQVSQWQTNFKMHSLTKDLL